MLETHLYNKDAEAQLVECLTCDRRVAGLSLTEVTALFS